MVAEEGRAELQQSQPMFLMTSKLDAVAKHASRIALTAGGSTACRVVGEGSTRHVRRGGSGGGVRGGNVVVSGLLELLELS
jgi:hypothetical protein